MEIQGDTIIFKSTHENYIKEKSGRKPNTVRIFTTSEELKKVEEFYDQWWMGNAKLKIKIIDQLSISFLPIDSFVSELVDITQYEGYWIFSWKHEVKT